MEKLIFVVSAQDYDENLTTVSDIRFEEMSRESETFYTVDEFINKFNDEVVDTSRDFVRYLVPSSEITPNTFSLEQLVKEDKATDMVCGLTGDPIFHETAVHMLLGTYYIDNENVDINKLIEEKSGGLYKFVEDVYVDEGHDYYYWTTYHEVDEIVNNIMEDGFYYDQNGIKIML